MANSILIGETKLDEQFLTDLIAARNLTNLDLVKFRDDAYGLDGVELRLRSLKVRGVEHRPVIVIVCLQGHGAFERVSNQVCKTDSYVAPAEPNMVSTGGGMYPPIAIIMLPHEGVSATDCAFDATARFLSELPLERTDIVDQEA
jgi:hypothetical protein